MPLFVCEICGCLDNTALGFYWPKEIALKDKWFEDKFLGKAMCSECTPTVDRYGEPLKINDYYGKWHNKFEKKTWKEWDYPKVMNRTYVERAAIILGEAAPKCQRQCVSMRMPTGKMTVIWLDELHKLSEEQLDSLITLYKRGN